MIVTAEQQQKISAEWLDVFGEVPEERQPGDMTAAEIADTWKIDKIAVYNKVKQGTLLSVKVIDESTGKSIIVYRINHDLEQRQHDHLPDPQ